MRGVPEILSDIHSQKAAYAAARETETTLQLEGRSTAIVGLQDELSQFIAKDGIACPQCSTEEDIAMPHGMIRCEPYRQGSKKVPALFEVGCLRCPARSQAYTPEAAVTRWNAKEYDL